MRMRHTLRGQPPPRSSTLRTAHSHPIRPPPLAHPIVESWLESIHPSPTSSSNRSNQPLATRHNPKSFYAATTKPVGEQFDRLPVVLQDVPVNQSRRAWLVVRLVPRVVSFIIATSALVVILGFLDNQRGWGVHRFVPAMAFVGITCMLTRASPNSIRLTVSQ